MASSSTSPFSRGRIMYTLTTVQHTSALVFGSFLFVHLAAPAVAVVAPQGETIELATKTMILGRVYYQNFLTEPVIVYASAAVHVASSLLKKALQLERQYRRNQSEKDAIQGYSIPDRDEPTNNPTSSSKKRRSPVSLHTVTGLLLMPAMALHSYLNRIAPSSSVSPINELSPSELDYSYVAHGFTTKSAAWRTITWALYALLLGAGAVHVVGGTDRIAKRIKARKTMESMKKQQQQADPLPLGASRAEVKRIETKRRERTRALINGAVSAAGVAWLAIGLRRMVLEERIVTSGWMTKRLDACYASVWPYSILR